MIHNTKQPWFPEPLMKNALKHQQILGDRTFNSVSIISQLSCSYWMHPPGFQHAHGLQGSVDTHHHPIIGYGCNIQSDYLSAKDRIQSFCQNVSFLRPHVSTFSLLQPLAWIYLETYLVTTFHGPQAKLINLSSVNEPG